MTGSRAAFFIERGRRAAPKSPWARDVHRRPLCLELSGFRQPKEQPTGAGSLRRDPPCTSLAHAPTKFRRVACSHMLTAVRPPGGKARDGRTVLKISSDGRQRGSASTREPSPDFSCTSAYS